MAQNPDPLLVQFFSTFPEWASSPEMRAWLLGFGLGTTIFLTRIMLGWIRGAVGENYAE